MAKRTCSVEDCSREHYARGWCRVHYDIWYRHGDPLWVRSEREPRHGTASEYDNFGCRCGECKAAKSQVMKDAYNTDREAAETRTVSDRDWRRLLHQYRHRCAYCGGRGPLTQEHVIPLKRGGRHAIGNLLPVCFSCNSSKGSKLLIEWRALRLLAVTA